MMFEEDVHHLGNETAIQLRQDLCGQLIVNPEFRKRNPRGLDMERRAIAQTIVEIEEERLRVPVTHNSRQRYSDRPH